MGFNAVHSPSSICINLLSSYSWMLMRYFLARSALARLALLLALLTLALLYFHHLYLHICWRNFLIFWNFEFMPHDTNSNLFLGEIFPKLAYVIYEWYLSWARACSCMPKHLSWGLEAVYWPHFFSFARLFTSLPAFLFRSYSSARKKGKKWFSRHFFLSLILLKERVTT